VLDGAICPSQFSSATNNSPLALCISDPHDLKCGAIKPVHINTICQSFD
jgi:hypothetical protein